MDPVKAWEFRLAAFEAWCNDVFPYALEVWAESSSGFVKCSGYVCDLNIVQVIGPVSKHKQDADFVMNDSMNLDSSFVNEFTYDVVLCIEWR